MLYNETYLLQLKYYPMHSLNNNASQEFKQLLSRLHVY